MQGRKTPSPEGASPANQDAGQQAGQLPTPPGSDLARLGRDLHDLNQPLSAIGNYAQAGVQLIDNGLADTARLKDLFNKILAQSARGTALSQQMARTLRGEQ